MTIKDGADLRAMTKEQLKEYINGQQVTLNDGASAQPASDQQPTEVNDDEVNDDKNTDQGASISDNQNTDVNKNKNNDNDPYGGKSTSELLSIIREQASMIGKQSNQVGEFKSRLNELEKASKAKPTEDNIDEDLKGYNKEDVNYVRKLIRNEVGALTKEQQAAAEAVKKEAFEHNQAIWNELSNDKVLYEKIHPILNAEYAKAGESAIYTKGWVSSKITQAMRQLIASGQQPASKVTPVKKIDTSAEALRKKRAAATVSSSGKTIGGTKKDVKSMTAKEYLEHMKETAGLTDKRR